MITLSDRLFVPLCLLLVAGCSAGGDLPELAQVEGTLKIDNQLAENVAVSFSPVAGGRPSVGITDSSGRYRLTYNTTDTGAVIGPHNVSITNHVNYDMNAPDAPMVPPDGKVPPKYTSLKKQVEVKPGSNTIDLEYP